MLQNSAFGDQTPPRPSLGLPQLCVCLAPPPHFHSSGLVEECPDRPALAVPFVLWQPCFHLLPTFL